MRVISSHYYNVVFIWCMSHYYGLSIILKTWNGPVNRHKLWYINLNRSSSLWSDPIEGILYITAINDWTNLNNHYGWKIMEFFGVIKLHLSKYFGLLHSSASSTDNWHGMLIKRSDYSFKFWFQGMLIFTLICNVTKERSALYLKEKETYTGQKLLKELREHLLLADLIRFYKKDGEIILIIQNRRCGQLVPCGHEDLPSSGV